MYLVHLALRSVRGRAVRHLPRAEGKFTATSLTLNMHLSAVRSFDKLLDSSNSYWYTVMKNKCWSIHLKVNLRFFMPDWLALWKINGAWFSYAQSRQTHRGPSVQRIFFLPPFENIKVLFFWLIHLRNSEIGKGKASNLFFKYSHILGSILTRLCQRHGGMREEAVRSLKGSVCVCWGGWVSFPQCPSFPLFVSPLNIRLCLREVTLSDWPYAR